MSGLTRHHLILDIWVEADPMSALCRSPADAEIIEGVERALGIGINYVQVPCVGLEPLRRTEWAQLQLVSFEAEVDNRS